MRGLGKRQPSVVSQTVRLPRGYAVSDFAVTSGRAGHRLDAARDEEIPVARDDGMRSGDHG